MSDLFNRVKQNMVGNQIESFGTTIANQNHEAFKDLCDILDAELT